MTNQRATSGARQRERPSGMPHRAPAAREGDRKRQLVVVAEDEPHEWEMYGKLLWYNGFDVIHARDGEQALALVRAHRPDLVILDLMLPKVDGLEVCRRLKGDDATRGIPVIALSARARWEMESKATAVGCMDYLEKPIGPLAVLHAVEDLIGRAPPAGADPGESRPQGPEGGRDAWH